MRQQGREGHQAHLSRQLGQPQGQARRPQRKHGQPIHPHKKLDQV